MHAGVSITIKGDDMIFSKFFWYGKIRAIISGLIFVSSRVRKKFALDFIYVCVCERERDSHSHGKHQSLKKPPLRPRGEGRTVTEVDHST